MRQPTYDPGLTQVCRRLAVLYDRQCDYARALPEYEQALKLSPKDADLLNDLGYCHYGRGDWAEAEKCLRRAVALRPDHRRAWVNLGLVLGRQGRWDEAIIEFRRSLPGPLWSASCEDADRLFAELRRAGRSVTTRAGKATANRRVC